MKNAMTFQVLLRLYGWCCCLLPAAVPIHATYAQQASFGNISIHSCAQISIAGTHYFETSRAGSQPGIVQTSRKGVPGVLHFRTPVSAAGSNESHVDGYVSQSGSTALLAFPVGDKGRLRPFFVQGPRAIGVTAKGAYFAADPQLAQSDDMAGQPDPTPLPAGAPFSTSKSDGSVGLVSKTEYWDIDCVSSAQLALSWDENSGVAALSEGSLANLRIVGWHNAQQRWVVIPSAADVTSKLGGASTTAKGTISTTSPIVANDYAVFTLGGKFTKVRLAVKVFLEGGTGMGAVVGTMRNDLQQYENDYGQKISLLPETAPYLPTAVYARIDDPNGPAGAVADWIKIEIWTAGSPQTLLEEQSLLLKTDGSVVDIDGQLPRFNAQDGVVRVIVRHRNHLGVSSNNISSFATGDISYDFTDGLDKAFKDNPGDPPLMKEIAPGSNKWCLWAADIVNDATIDSADLTPFDNAFKNNVFEQYNLSDVNLDGVVDSVDVSIMEINFLKNLFSNIPYGDE